MAMIVAMLPFTAVANQERSRMDERRFWGLVEQARRVAPGHDVDAAERQAFALETWLLKLAAEDIVAFQEILDRKMAESYRWDLWGAAYMLNGGCSDDCFDYFRGWLIGRGRKVFETALKNPDSLAEFAADPRRTSPSDAARECESFLYVARNAYRKATGADMPQINRPTLGKPKGAPWKEEDLPRILPAIAAKVL